MTLTSLPLENYKDAHVFDGFRFSRMREADKTKYQMVNTDCEFLLFGHGYHACPGRCVLPPLHLFPYHQSSSLSLHPFCALLLHSLPSFVLPVLTYADLLILPSFFAANELKAMLAHLVLHYDVQLEGGSRVKPENEWNTTSASPRRTAKAMFRKRLL